MFTRLAESLILGVISGGFAAYVSLTKLETKFDAYVQSDKIAHEETKQKLSEIDRCLRERTCTK